VGHLCQLARVGSVISSVGLACQHGGVGAYLSVRWWHIRMVVGPTYRDDGGFHMSLGRLCSLT
jgi:hypothetical protein